MLFCVCDRGYRLQEGLKEKGSKGISGSYRESGRKKERVTHLGSEREKRERIRERKTPLFLPGGRGNSELGCHLENYLHLHLSSPR